MVESRMAGSQEAQPTRQAHAIEKKFNYPPDTCTFAELLHWHLYVHGTRLNGRRNLWEPQNFIDKARCTDRSLRRYLGEGAPPDQKNFGLIKEALLDKPPHNQEWADDLENARIRSRRNGNLWTAPGQRRRSRARTSEVGPDITVQPTAMVLSAKDVHLPLGTAAMENVELIAEQLTDIFVGRQSDIEFIDSFVTQRMNGSPHSLLVITGHGGCGKSALAAHWCRTSQTTARTVVKHFCAARGGSATTATRNIYAHLLLQIARFFDVTPDKEEFADSLTALLRKDAPPGRELVIWLDGLDEADDIIPCFLPQKLGERICVIVSARDDFNRHNPISKDRPFRVVPPYLSPWLESNMARSHKVTTHFLGMMSVADVSTLLEELFRRHGIGEPPEDLAGKIHNASGRGTPLFVRHRVQAAIESAIADGTFQYYEESSGLSSYIEGELRQMERHPKWPELQPMFAVLSATYFISLDELPALFGLTLFPGSIPGVLMRWLFITSGVSDRPPFIGFTHHEIARAFKKALGYQVKESFKAIFARLMGMPAVSWPEDWLDRLPSRLQEEALFAESRALLTNDDFIEARFEKLPEKLACGGVAAAWEKYADPHFNPSLSDGERAHAQRHADFWRNCSIALFNEELTSLKLNWRRLYNEAGLSSPA